ncbi:hypothetical protein EVJ58_g7752 [Rhodofomes roseus]|uniref:Uncharacterized protein n=1 Tax=Rhodofomes roseus TaxID=34475 RepID=A0A4Y9Y495_9APHY|nr:hypothetical protein EVJ58_g7752 [Rhodofomes roseus]
MTERAWDKIRDEMSSYMQDIKDRRVASERSAVLRDRLKTLSLLITSLRDILGRGPSMELHPKFADYALMPEFRALVEAPNEETIDWETVTVLLESLPKLNLRWLRQRVLLLGKMLETALGRVSVETDAELERKADSENTRYDHLLDLAIAVLECRKCSERMPALDAISHRCARGLSWTLAGGASELRYLSQLLSVSRGVRPWSIDCFEVPDLEPIKRTIRACGKDPETVTVDEMDALDVRLAVKGSFVEGKRKIMTLAAVLRTGHVDETVCESGWQFEVLSEEDKHRVLELELEAREERLLFPAVLEEDADYWCCMLCDDQAACTYPGILHHLNYMLTSNGDCGCVAGKSTSSQSLRYSAVELSAMPRKKAKLTPESAAPSLPDAPVVELKPMASHALTTKKQLRGKRGRLRDMPNMPMDILLESIIWEFGVRYCSSCKKSMMVKLSFGGPYGRFLRDNWLNVLVLLNKTRIKKNTFYHGLQIEQVKQAWDGLHDDADRRSQYVSQQRQRIQDIQKHAQACSLWAAKRADARAEELEQIKRMRLQFIVLKLRDMGWGEEIDKLPDDMRMLADHAQVRPAKEITERGWEKIRDELSSFMQQIKDLRVGEERSTLLPTERFPKFADFAYMHEFRELVEAPNEETIDRAAFEALDVPTVDSRWMVQRLTQLKELFEESSNSIQGDTHQEQREGGMVEFLGLAVAVFECKQCFKRMHVIDTQAHRCARDAGMYWFLDRDDDRGSEHSYERQVRRVARDVYTWDIHKFRVPDLEPLKNIIRMCGKDPATVTAQEMDDLDVRLAMDDLINGDRKVMTWDTVVRIGHLDQTVCDSGWHFEVLSEDDKRRVVELELQQKDEIVTDILMSAKKYLCCALCDEMASGTTFPILMEHLEAR